ncbi:DoxX family protein [Pseudooceanicola onchidii]|uniref:DoxX family protein n=1 Tax=Pseudooceanicola onchidii TaxID=2562279 RepID=UPI0010A9A5D9|nr:DoxX family protein [Pseudooceanicola onchidii]
MSDKMMIRAGWALSILYGLFMLGASVMPKFVSDIGSQTLADLGWPDSPILLIGVIELLCTVLYLVPRTGLLGACLSMAVLGGAMVTQIRAGSPLFSHTLFSLYLGTVMWAGLWLRDPAVRTVWPVRRR